MRKRNLFILSILSCLVSLPVFAGWQYPGEYVGDAWYMDDGSRFVISARGGAAFGNGKIKNEIGAASVGYYVLSDSGLIVPYGQCMIDKSCSLLEFAGYANFSQLTASKDFEGFSIAAGASIGWTISNKPQWRLEAGWDHISETEYNSSPMFQGEVSLEGGSWSNAYVESSSVNSKISTDVISAMAFYDFFDGLYKPTRQMIPYVGFGVGYSNTKTTLNLVDPYGDLSGQGEFANYGEPDSYGLTQFFTSEYETSNVVGLLAVGFSYGLNETMFLDFGVRGMYIPRVKWELSNEDGTKHREFFSAENLFYVNAMLGLRFEF